MKKYEFEIFESGMTYTHALKLKVDEEDRHDMERVLFENGCEIRIRPLEEEDDSLRPCSHDEK